MEYCLYRTVNRVNGKFYYGVHSSKNLKTDTYIGSGTILQRAVLKYGKENFIREDLEYFASLEEAYRREFEILTPELLMDPNCYNEKFGGKGGQIDTITVNDGQKEIRIYRENLPTFLANGWKKGWLETHKRNSGNAKKGRKVLHRGDKIKRVLPEELDDYVQKGWTLGNPDCVLMKFKKARQARVITEEIKAKISNTLKGHSVSDETREKIRKSLTGRESPKRGKKVSLEIRKKMSLAKKGKPTHNTGKVCVSREGIITYIQQKDFNRFRKEGWVRGRKG